MGKSTKKKKSKSKKSTSTKKVVKNTKNDEVLELKKEIEKSVDGKDKKNEKKEKTKKAKFNVKNKKIGWLIASIILIVPLVFLIIINKNNYNENTSYITKNSITISSPETTFKAPIYSFAVDKKEKPIEIDNLIFLDNYITYRFIDAKREVLDDGNVMISVNCEMDAEIDYIEKDDIEEDWFYTFSYAPAFSFDYYTGDVYLEKTIADSKTILMGEGKTKNSQKEEMATTNLTVKNKEIKISVLNNEISNKWGSNIYDGKDADGRRYKATNKSIIVMYFKVPKDYDGMMIAINKKGSSYESWKKDFDRYTKLVSLQEEFEKTGKKSNELESLEKEKTTVYKLLDNNNEKRKDFTKDDYYVFRVIDLFKDDYIIKAENNVNIMYIFGIIVLIMSIITCLLMYLKKDN